MAVMSTHPIGLRVAVMYRSVMVIILALVVEMYKAVVVIMVKAEPIFPIPRLIDHFVIVAIYHEQINSRNHLRVLRQIPHDRSALGRMAIGQSTIHLIDHALRVVIQVPGHHA